MNVIKRCAGINITSSRLQFVELEKESDKLFLTNLGQTFIIPSINFDEIDETILSTKLQNAFDELTIQNPLINTAVSFTLPPELFVTIQLPYDKNLSNHEITEEFRWEISQLYPFIPAEELAIKFYELNGSILPGNNNALIVALDKKYLVLLKNFCSKNNLSPKLVDNSSVTANGFINSYSSLKESGTINIYNSKNSLTLFINISSKPAYVKVYQKDSNELSNSLLKLLSDEKIKNILKSSIKLGFFFGEDIHSDMINQLQQITGLEFVKFNPFINVEAKSDIDIHAIAGEQFSIFTASAGIAARSN
jgi:Tfp pilus assembly PilM family ATPase